MTPVRTSRWLRLGPLSDLPARGAVEVRIDDACLALCRDGDELHLVDGRCPHQAGPLAEGEVADGTVTCPLHQWRYDLRTGARVDRVGASIGTHAVRAHDGWVEARWTDAEHS